MNTCYSASLLMLKSEMVKGQPFWNRGSLYFGPGLGWCQLTDSANCQGLCSVVCCSAGWFPGTITATGSLHIPVSVAEMAAGRWGSRCCDNVGCNLWPPAAPHTCLSPPEEQSAKEVGGHTNNTHKHVCTHTQIPRHTDETESTDSLYE